MAVAFSGGLDCSIVASLSKRYADSVTLYTVGVDGAYDVQMGRQMSEVMGIPWEHIRISEENLLGGVAEMMRITRTASPVTLSFEIPLFFVSKNCREGLIIGGQGADELFGGYSRYIGLSEDDVRDCMREDMARLLTETLEHESKVSCSFGKKVLYPYLDEDVVRVAGQTSVGRISPTDARKGSLREVAVLIGESEAAAKKKKAAQYGSGSMSLLRRIARSEGLTVNGLITKIYDCECRD
jgi:asparagine synthase (glutamine-hydrolysing)